MTLSLLQEEPDEDMQRQFDHDLERVGEQLEQYRLEQLLDEPYDANNAILEIHPGAGGTESQDWGEMLLRMYTRWAGQHQFQVEVADYEAGDEAGIKSVTVLVNGHNAYGYLRSEKGDHPFTNGNCGFVTGSTVTATKPGDRNEHVEI